MYIFLPSAPVQYEELFRLTFILLNFRQQLVELSRVFFSASGSGQVTIKN